jgi:cyclic beta-1,2-glucan synthetase
LAVEGVLGLRLRNGRLRIDPCLPPEWDRFEAEVRRDGGTLTISVEVSSELAPGARELTVDGVWRQDAEVPFPVDGSSRRVHLCLGPPIGRQAPQVAAGAASQSL